MLPLKNHKTVQRSALSGRWSMSTAPANVIDFDYAALSAEIAKVVKLAAERIKDRMTTNIIKIGKDLLAVKEQLDHGQFIAWLSAELAMTPRSAQRYMTVARLAGKCNEVRDLPPSALYALSAPTTPQSVQAEIFKRLTAGEHIETRAIQAEIRKAKEDCADKPKVRATKQRKRSHRAKVPAKQKATPKLPVTFTKNVGPVIRGRQSPADKHYFRARIRHEGDHLVIVDISPDKGSAEAKHA